MDHPSPACPCSSNASEGDAERGGDEREEMARPEVPLDLARVQRRVVKQNRDEDEGVSMGEDEAAPKRARVEEEGRGAARAVAAPVAAEGAAASSAATGAGAGAPSGFVSARVSPLVQALFALAASNLEVSEGEHARSSAAAARLPLRAPGSVWERITEPEVRGAAEASGVVREALGVDDEEMVRGRQWGSVRGADAGLRLLAVDDIVQSVADFLSLRLRRPLPFGGESRLIRSALMAGDYPRLKLLLGRFAPIQVLPNMLALAAGSGSETFVQTMWPRQSPEGDSGMVHEGRVRLLGAVIREWRADRLAHMLEWCLAPDRWEGARREQHAGFAAHEAMGRVMERGGPVETAQVVARVRPDVSWGRVWWHGFTMLQLAVRGGSGALVDFVLSDPLCSRHDVIRRLLMVSNAAPRMTALQMAAQRGSADVAWGLLGRFPSEEELEAFPCDEEGRERLQRQAEADICAALRHAAFGGHVDAVDVFLNSERVSDAAITAVMCESPLIKRRDVLHRLAEATERYDWVTVVRACIFNRDDRFLLLLREAGVERVHDEAYRGYRTALHYALATNAEDLFVKLVDTAEPDELNARNDRSQHLLHLASSRPHFLHALLRKVVVLDVDAVDASGDTPLHVAVRSGNEGFVLTLLANEANPALANHQDISPREEAQRLAQHDDVWANIARHLLPGSPPGALPPGTRVD